MMDTPDTTLHKLTICYNSIPRTDVKEAVRRTGDINKKLLAQHAISEPETSRMNVTKEVFDRMSLVESVIAIKDLSRYLGNKQLQLTSDLQQAKNEVKEATRTKTNDEIVNDMIK